MIKWIPNLFHLAFHLKNKYRLIRDQKIRERVEALGVQVQEGDDREILLQKEREYLLERQKIENCLESFYRSASSLVFQLNKRHITRRGKWDSKCKINSTYILYYDRDRSNYRYASNKLSPIHISIGLNKEEMRVIQ